MDDINRCSQNTNGDTQMSITEEIKAIPVRYNRGEFGQELHYAHYAEGFNDALEEASVIGGKHEVHYEARIKQLEEMLRWYIEEDEINECDPANQYWIDGKHKAMRLLGMQVEEQD